MSTATFLRFKELPYELREKVWLLSIRDVSTSGIRFFTVHDDPSDDDHNVVFHRSKRLKNPVLAAPQPSHEHAQKGYPSSDASTATNPWRHNNDSTYLIDSGLWTACKESRALMEKQPKTREFPKCTTEDPDAELLFGCPAQPHSSLRLEPRKSCATSPYIHGLMYLYFKTGILRNTT
jgi:hypothetical protein